MTIIQAYKKKVIKAEIRFAIQNNLTNWAEYNRYVFASIARQRYGERFFSNRALTSPIQRLGRASRKRFRPEVLTESELPEALPNRYSVVYLINDQHQHAGCGSYEEAKHLVDKLQDDPNREPIGIYDDKTELFEWEPMLKEIYDQSSIHEQGVHGAEIISIAQALRRRDSSWHQGGFQRPSIFA